MSGSPQAASIWGWRGAASGVVDRQKQLLNTGERSDVEFAVGSEHGERQMFRAHKFVLGSGSDVFDRMFCGGVLQNTDKPIEVPDILPQSFALMLKYIYTDAVEELNLENVLPTMYCAKKYGIPKLFDLSVDYAVKNVDNETCLTMLEAAKVLDAEKVVSKCTEILDARCTELLHSEGFLRLKKETLREIFSRDTLIITEEEIYKAAQRWAANACQSNSLESTGASYRLVLGEALFAVRFSLMDAGQLANGPVADGLLRDEELRKIFQFKYAAEKPDMPFSSTPRSSGIVFCDRRWKILHTAGTNVPTTMGNVFLDEHGHLRLRLSQHDGVWKGAEVQLCDGLRFGRYEFQIAGLDRLEPSVNFALISDAVNGRALGTYYARVRGPVGGVQRSCHGVSFSLRSPNCIACCSADKATFSKTSEGPGQTHLTHSFHWKPHSVSFTCQRGHQHNNTADGLVCSWSYDTKPNIPQTALSLYMCLYSVGIAPPGRKEVEIILHSFRFYPDA